MGHYNSTYQTYFKQRRDANGAIVVDHVALSTAAAACTGYLVSRWLTASGWGCSTIADNSLQLVGAVQDTPSSVGAIVPVVVEGLAQNVLLSPATGTTFAGGDMCVLTSDAAWSTGTTWTSPPSTRAVGVFMSSGTGIGDVWLFDQSREADSTT